MTKTKKIIQHKCECKDCKIGWNSSDVYSVCPLCAKKVVAKICISVPTTVEVKDEDTEE